MNWKKIYDTLTWVVCLKNCFFSILSRSEISFLTFEIKKYSMFGIYEDKFKQNIMNERFSYMIKIKNPKTWIFENFTWILRLGGKLLICRSVYCLQLCHIISFILYKTCFAGSRDKPFLPLIIQQGEGPSSSRP